MKVLLVIDSLGSGGAQRQIGILGQGLATLGHDVFFVTYHNLDFFEELVSLPSITRIRLVKRDRVGLNIVSSMVSIVRKNNIDCIISFLHTPNLYASLVKFIVGRKLKFIASYRSMTEFKKISVFTKLKFFFVNYYADKIVANSNHERERWQSYSRGSAHKWLTIYNCVLFEDTRDIRRIDNDILVVGSVGKDKNGLRVLEALKFLKERGLEVKVRWIGSKVYSIEERANYINLMELYIQDHFLGEYFEWKEPTPDILREYQRCDALLLASEVEGLPNVVCEAMSVGTPIIISDVLDHDLLVEDGKEGFLFDPSDSVELANCLEKYSSLSLEEKSEFGKNAKIKSRLLFNQETFIRSYCRLI